MSPQKAMTWVLFLFLIFVPGHSKAMLVCWDPPEEEVSGHKIYQNQSLVCTVPAEFDCARLDAGDYSLISVSAFIQFEQADGLLVELESEKTPAVKGENFPAKKYFDCANDWPRIASLLP